MWYWYRAEHPYFANLHRLTQADAKSALDAIYSRRRLLRTRTAAIVVIPMLAMAFLAWARPSIILPPITAVISPFMKLFGNTCGVFIAVGLVWIPFMIALASIAHRLHIRTLTREFDDCLNRPLCFHCRYPLTGIESNNDRRTCPECGNQSPVATV